MIPKIIHQTCKHKNNLSAYAKFSHKLVELNPDFTIKIYDDEDAKMLVEKYFPNWIKSYNAYQHHIQRTDIFRLMVVYLFGGFYLDMDMLALKSFHSLCNFNLVLGEEKTISEEECKRLNHANPLRIANYMFGSEAKHPFWLQALAAAFEKSSSPIHDENDILETTGPGLLTTIFHQQQHVFNDITLIQNDNQKCVKNCSNIPSCHFGDYAAHLHQGSWRWQHNTKKLNHENSYNHSSNLER